jgi:HEPN domain-containing protein
MNDPQREADRWWRQASADLDFLPFVAQAGKYDTCCFLAQQTADKALKAYLFSQGEELIFTHSIFKLCDLAARFDPFFAALKDAVKTLDYYYVEARYPNALQDVIPAEFYSARDAAEAIRMATDVHRAVGARLALQDKDGWPNVQAVCAVERQKHHQGKEIRAS